MTQIQRIPGCASTQKKWTQYCRRCLQTMGHGATATSITIGLAERMNPFRLSLNSAAGICQRTERKFKIKDIAKPNDKKREGYRYKRVYSKKYGIDTENDLQTEVREQVTKAIADLKNWEKKLLIKLQQN